MLTVYVGRLGGGDIDRDISDGELNEIAIRLVLLGCARIDVSNQAIAVLGRDKRKELNKEVSRAGLLGVAWFRVLCYLHCHWPD